MKNLNIKQRIMYAYHWLDSHPRAMLNLFFLLLALGGFIYLMVKPIDVLEDWHLATIDAEATRDNLPLYHPGESLIFTSKSVKLVNAKGTTTRMIICEATANQREREIQLDSLPATRPAGVNKQRDNAIVVPDVAQFNGLPRVCRLSIDVCYEDVVLWRDHCEHTESNRFLVDEEELSPAEIRKIIEELNGRIKQLEGMLAKAEGTSSSSSNTPAPTASTPTSPSNNSVASRPTPSQNSGGNAGGTTTPPPAEEDFIHSVPVVGDVLTALGL